MNATHVYEPAGQKFFTPGVYVLLAFMFLGLAAAAQRFVMGLAAATNLSDSYPWGIWIAIDVASGVALAAGGFTTAALAHIFHQKHYEPIVRPALLTAMLGYTFVALGLLADLGRYYNIWHPMLPSMWQGNSVLFEVAMCVMAYLTVLYLEFTPVVCERFAGRVRLPGKLAALNRPVDAALRAADRGLRKSMFLLVIAGVVLSFMHQSSLGSLMLIAPHKMHPLWYTPILPLLFLLSAISVGYPMVIFESTLSSVSFKRHPETHILAPLSRFVVAFAGLYVFVKTADLFIRGAHVYLLDGSLASNAFLIEMALMIAPMIMLLFRRVRWTPWLLFASATMVVVGVAVNRINVFLVAYQPPFSQNRYFPSIQEILVTAGLISTLVLIYRVAVTFLPVLPAVGHNESHSGPQADA